MHQIFRKLVGHRDLVVGELHSLLPDINCWIKVCVFNNQLENTPAQKPVYNPVEDLFMVMRSFKFGSTNCYRVWVENFGP